VAPAVAVEVHKLWSRTGASPHARDLGHRAFGLQPLARGELGVAEILVDADLPAVKLPDEQVLPAVAIDVGPAWRRPTAGLDPERLAARFEPDRWLELAREPDSKSASREESREQRQSQGSPLRRRERKGRTARRRPAASIHMIISWCARNHYVMCVP